MTESNRSKTPVTRMWFEFLLDDNLLDQHLAESNPDPSPGELFALFYYQAFVSAETEKAIAAEQHRDVASEDNKKMKALKLLALRVACHMKWDMNLLDKTVPQAMVEDILLELMKYVLPGENVEPSNHRNLKFENLSGVALFAIQLYHRWCLKQTIQAALPVKPIKDQNVQVPGMLDPKVAVVKCKDDVLKSILNRRDESTVLLSRLSGVGRDVAMPISSCFGSYHNSEEPTQDWSKCIVIKENELLCHICYDLGAVYFLLQKYTEAYAMFNKATELCSQLGGEVLSSSDLERLFGYHAACSGILGKRQASPSLLQRVEEDRRNGHKDTATLLLEDNIKRELSVSYRIAIEEEMKKENPESRMYQCVVICNGVRRILDERLLSMDFMLMMRSRSGPLSPVLLQCVEGMLPTCSYNQKSRLDHLLRFLYHSLDLSFAAEVSKYAGVCEVLKDLVKQPKQEKQVTPLVVEPPVDVQQLLLCCYDPDKLRDLVNRLPLQQGKMQPLQVRHLSDKWKILRDFAVILDMVPIPFVQVYTHILIAKAQICASLDEYAMAKKLLQAAIVAAKDISYKLSKILPWEMLRMELLYFNKHGKFCGDDISGLKRRVRQILSTVDPKFNGGAGKHDIRPHEEVLIECVVFLLNVGDWEALMIFNSRSGYIEFGRLVAMLCKELTQPSSARKPGVDLWTAMCLVFANLPGGAPKRRADGSDVPKEGKQGPISQQQLQEMIKGFSEPSVLAVFISLLARLYTCLRDDVNTEICTDYRYLWPTTVATPGNLNATAVEETIHCTLNRALELSPCQSTLLRTNADLCYVSGQYGPALKNYIAMGLKLTDYFYEPVSKSVYDDTLFRRMIKCCCALQCFTQAAVLCQCLEETDYNQAFRALSEKVTHDSVDTYYENIWDSNMLEFIIHLHTKRGQLDKKQIALAAIRTPELNASNPVEILYEAARVRKARFLRAMTRQYV